MSQETGGFARSNEVLLVDDHPQIRKLLANLLSRDQNYHVTTASSGEEALDLSRNRSDKIDILITDIDMGEMSGIELYRHIREERPDTAVFFISALASRIGELLPNLPVLQKPFMPGEFVAKVGRSAFRTQIRCPPHTFVLVDFNSCGFYTLVFSKQGSTNLFAGRSEV
jgi:CheY-like chemotaxis protein